MNYISPFFRTLLYLMTFIVVGYVMIELVKLISGWNVFLTILGGLGIGFLFGNLLGPLGEYLQVVPSPRGSLTPIVRLVAVLISMVVVSVLVITTKIPPEDSHPIVAKVIGVVLTIFCYSAFV